MSNPNKTKALQLGMPYGTACGRLRKRLLFHLAEQLGLTSCHRCGKTIDDVGEFSIDHKKPWLHASANLFWDLDNIAFSHLTCNARAGQKKGARKPMTAGKLQCSACKSWKLVCDFPKQSTTFHGVGARCKPCHAARIAKWRRDKGA